LVIREVLEHIYRKGYVKVDEISEELGIPKSLVEHVIRELKNKKYLEEAYCSFCPLKSKCHIKTAGVIKSYILTEKAKRLLKTI